ncbi:MAG: PilZ domain-containing protein [Proteobacteria bacterium]|nr:PilZ domain-containing protein [Pseudomonadota bacterium]
MASNLTTRESGEKKPAKRFENCDVLVTARTLGTKLNFKMPVLNLSATGMLLGWLEKPRVPFHLNTLLELSVSSEESGTKTTIQCLAKVIHTKTDVSGDRRFGVRIIQSDDEDMAPWNSIVDSIERNHPSALGDTEESA